MHGNQLTKKDVRKKYKRVLRWSKKGYSIGQIAFRVGTSRQWVSQILQRTGAPAEKARAKRIESTAEKVRSLCKRGLSDLQIATKVGLSPSSVPHYRQVFHIRRSGRCQICGGSYEILTSQKTCPNCASLRGHWTHVKWAISKHPILLEAAIRYFGRRTTGAEKKYPLHRKR